MIQKWWDSSTEAGNNASSNTEIWIACVWGSAAISPGFVKAVKERGEYLLLGAQKNFSPLFRNLVRDFAISAWRQRYFLKKPR